MTWSFIFCSLFLSIFFLRYPSGCRKFVSELSPTLLSYACETPFLVYALQVQVFLSLFDFFIHLCVNVLLSRTGFYARSCIAIIWFTCL
jgi:hypothetical protein